MGGSGVDFGEAEEFDGVEGEVAVGVGGEEEAEAGAGLPGLAGVGGGAMRAGRSRGPAKVMWICCSWPAGRVASNGVLSWVVIASTRS